MPLRSTSKFFFFWLISPKIPNTVKMLFKELEKEFQVMAFEMINIKFFLITKYGKFRQKNQIWRILGIKVVLLM